MMTSWYIDPCWDPMQELHDCKTDVAMLKGNCLQLAAAYNDHGDMVTQLAAQNKRLIAMIQNLSREVMDITNKLELLERDK